MLKFSKKTTADHWVHADMKGSDNLLFILFLGLIPSFHLWMFFDLICLPIQLLITGSEILLFPFLSTKSDRFIPEYSH